MYIFLQRPRQVHTSLSFLLLHFEIIFHLDTLFSYLCFDEYCMFLSFLRFFFFFFFAYLLPRCPDVSMYCRMFPIVATLRFIYSSDTQIILSIFLFSFYYLFLSFLFLPISLFIYSRFCRPLCNRQHSEEVFG